MKASEARTLTAKHRDVLVDVYKQIEKEATKGNFGCLVLISSEHLGHVIRTLGLLGYKVNVQAESLMSSYILIDWEEKGL